MTCNQGQHVLKESDNTTAFLAETAFADDRDEFEIIDGQRLALTPTFSDCERLYRMDDPQSLAGMPRRSESCQAHH